MKQAIKNENNSLIYNATSLSRIAISVSLHYTFSLFILILYFQTIEAYYWSYNYDDRQHCLQCDPKNSVGEPIEIWDNFPCPPASDPDLFLDLDWTGKLGPIDGEIVRKRVAKRCGITISLAGPHPGYAESTLFIENCDINCILVVLAVFLCCVVLSVPAVLCCFKRYHFLFQNIQTSQYT